MLEQLLINNDFETAMLLGVLVILILLAAVSLGYGLSAWFIDGDFFLGLFVIIIAIIGVCGGYVSLTQLNKKAEQIKTIQKGHVQDYYKLTKDGKAIKFTLKDSKSDMLKKQAEAKIIDEDSNTYQIQYKDAIDRVPKSAVK